MGQSVKVMLYKAEVWLKKMKKYENHMQGYKHFSQDDRVISAVL